jgi:hypothetical protein
MKWFKHPTNSRRSLFIRELLDKHGDRGYRIWYSLLETFCEHLDPKSGNCEVRLRVEDWVMELGIGAKSTQKFKDVVHLAVFHDLLLMYEYGIYMTLAPRQVTEMFDKYNASSAKKKEVDSQKLPPDLIRLDMNRFDLIRKEEEEKKIQTSTEVNNSLITEKPILKKEEPVTVSPSLESGIENGIHLPGYGKISEPAIERILGHRISLVGGSP